MKNEVYTLPFNLHTNVSTNWITLQGDKLLIMKGYCYDGATFFPDFGWIKVPSLIHDALCQLVRIGLMHDTHQVQIDQCLREACRTRLPRGLKYMADIVYTGVRGFGKLFKGKGPQDKIYYVL